jgi:hypothetical protein
MPETNFAANDEIARSDLINFLKAIPDGRFLRGVRYPQWFLLLVGVLGDPERLPQLSRFGEFCSPAPGSPQPGAGPGVQALAIGCHLSLTVQQRSPAGVWPGAAGLDDQPDPWWRIGFGPAGL